MAITRKKNVTDSSPRRRSAIRLNAAARSRLKEIREKTPISDAPIASRWSFPIALVLYASFAAGLVLYPDPPRQVEVARYTIYLRHSVPRQTQTQPETPPKTLRPRRNIKVQQQTEFAERMQDAITPPDVALPNWADEPHTRVASVIADEPRTDDSLRLKREVRLETAPPVPPPRPVAPEIATYAPEAIAIDVQGLQSNFWSVVHAHTTAKLRYPGLAKRRGLEGEVVVALTIGADGSVVTLEEKSASREIFLRAVQNAVSAAEPYPAPPEDLPKPVMLEMPVAFRIRD